KEYLKQTPKVFCPASTASEQQRLSPPNNSWRSEDPDYYNDLPGKVPPDVTPPPVPPLPRYHPQHNQKRDLDSVIESNSAIKEEVNISENRQHLIGLNKSANGKGPGCGG